MHPNEALIHRLYTAFQARDAAGMAGCYHPRAVFTDPAFGRLEGGQVPAMWAMLINRATDLEVSFSDVGAVDESGHARWEARYTFGRTGRKVLNRIEARFAFADGLIVRHDDRFPFWRWARQALGPAGVLLGWAPFLRGRVRSTARRGLEQHMRRAAAPGASLPRA